MEPDSSTSRWFLDVLVIIGFWITKLPNYLARQVPCAIGGLWSHWKLLLKMLFVSRYFKLRGFGDRWPLLDRDAAL